jgi:hypothetical protein
MFARGNRSKQLYTAECVRNVRSLAMARA